MSLQYETFPLRQVHLDFHTSPFIHDVSVDFDAVEFAKTIKASHVNSVTVFAKCHHGMSYYPTKTGTVHPALKGRDLLGEQIEALHREGIRAPIYTTVVWEEDVAQKHPEWRQMDNQGGFAVPSWQGCQPGTWKFNNFLDPDYQDYMESHVREICANYDVDGIFFDIVFFCPGACWSESSMRFRSKHGLTSDDAATFRRFESLAQVAFASKFTKILRGLKPKATVFYNSANDMSMDSKVGARARAPHQTHCEIESLPSGFWGYHHFPRMARGQSHWGKPWIGMTGRFQRSWGDFGGIKPQAALEYECFRSQALGGGNSVGDQLPPRGKLDPAAYKLIGAVYEQCEKAEPFYEGTQPVCSVGIFSAGYPGFDVDEAGKSEEGAIQLCDEIHHDTAVLDADSDLKGFELLILPDSTIVTAKLVKKLRAFYQNGGCLMISHRSGFDSSGKWALDFLPISFHGEEDVAPTYWRGVGDYSKVLHGSDLVFYKKGMKVIGGSEAKAIVKRVLPYFKRSDVHFCSHSQTPPVKNASKFPAVLAGKGFVYFADPVFQEYRQSGNIAAREMFRALAGELVGRPPFGHGLPSNVLVVPRRRGDDLLLTLLHYVPVRRAIEVDIIEEASGFAGECLQMPAHVKHVIDFETGDQLLVECEGRFVLPSRKGRLLLLVPGFFSGHSKKSILGTKP